MGVERRSNRSRIVVVTNPLNKNRKHVVRISSYNDANQTTLKLWVYYQPKVSRFIEQDAVNIQIRGRKTIKRTQKPPENIIAGSRWAKFVYYNNFIRMNGEMGNWIPLYIYKP